MYLALAFESSSFIVFLSCQSLEYSARVFSQIDFNQFVIQFGIISKSIIRVIYGSSLFIPPGIYPVDIPKFK